MVLALEQVPATVYRIAASSAVAGGHARRTLNLVAAVCGSAYSAHLTPWPLDGAAVGRRRVALGCCSPAGSCCAAAVTSSSNQLVIMDTRTPAWLTSRSGVLCHASPLALPLRARRRVAVPRRATGPAPRHPGTQTDRQTDRPQLDRYRLLGGRGCCRVCPGRVTGTGIL